MDLGCFHLRKTTDNKLPIYIIFGPNGAGLSSALNVFCEFRYLTLGGVTPEILRQSLPILVSEHPAIVYHLALDPKNTNIQDTKTFLEDLHNTIPTLKILYLSTPTDVLLQRFDTNQKIHPYQPDGLDLRYAIEQEQLLYQALKPVTDYHIDTSKISVEELRLKIAKLLHIEIESQPIALNLMSFGFKYNIPTEADIVFDVRFLPNPFYDASLKPLSGLDKPVYDYVLGFEETRQFLDKLADLLLGILPAYQQQGRTRLNIAIGCTGGQHRSVAIIEALAKQLKTKLAENEVNIKHREMPHWQHLKKEAVR